MVIYVVAFLVLNSLVSTIFSLMVVLVYAGAMLIFIGYVCAVCPNPIFYSSFSILVLSVGFTATLLLTGRLSLGGAASARRSDFFSLIDFFYSSDGVSFLLLLVFILFFVLLLVNSQHYTSKGPFRSV